MNSTIYVFGNFTNKYTQYPDDYTKDIFDTFYKNSTQESQIITHRDNNIMYYGYIRKLANAGSENYIGFCIVINGMMIVNLYRLFIIFENLITDLLINGYIIEFNKNGDIVSKVSKQLYRQQTIIQHIKDYIDFYIRDFNNDNFSYNKLPAVNYAISKDEKKDWVLNNDNLTQIMEDTCKYNYTWITTDKDINVTTYTKYKDVIKSLNEDKINLQNRFTETIISYNKIIDSKKKETRRNRTDKIKDIIKTIFGVIWGLVGICGAVGIVVALISWGIRSCKDSNNTATATATETLCTTSAETPIASQTETYSTEVANDGPKIISYPYIRKKCDKHTVIKNITITDENTIIEMKFNNTIDGGGYWGWCAIDANTYIRANGKKYFLTKVEGIEITPKVTYFNGPNENIDFTLYFSPIPKTTKEINLIENATSSWRFYGIKL